MDKEAKADISAAFAGALDWWRDAGVDCDFVDEPVRWISPSEKAQSPAEEADRSAPPNRTGAQVPPAPPPLERIDPASLPADLASFTEWWLSEPLLASGSLRARVPPRGPAAAEMMVVVPEPEPEDGERLLAAGQGRLLANMLAAMGLNEEQVYFASVLPRCLPGADWAELAVTGMGDVLAHHVALVQPKRLAVFGTNILPLFGHDPPQGPADLRIFNHQCVSFPMLAVRSLAALLEQPRWKARVWQAWLEWAG